ncbi:hypothetical protein H6P81_013041 [Aristolochia fimbriata]|uniref:NHL repeat-containing protein 2 n=1 Tax=Aristolochia fimbriata TaxID=158543 RepID=A0AAV7EI74_ARIFI|nr:hypothetical protein H6P81_013041 [Aristolochia fimbriata]
MAFRYRRLREISRVFPQLLYSGVREQRRRSYILSYARYLSHRRPETNTGARGDNVRMCSTVSEAISDSLGLDFFAFAEAALDELKGPCHCWLNKISEKPFRKDGIFLVVTGIFLHKQVGSNPTVNFDRIKFLKQRFPELNIFGFQYSSSIGSTDIQAQVLQTIMEEFITFPILLSNKGFPEINKVEYFVFQGLKSPVIFHSNGTDFGAVVKAIKEIYVLKNATVVKVHSKSTWVREPDVIEEPHASSSFRNLLLYFPGFISVDEDGGRLFLSDSNHHRIITTDLDGKILDCIGSFPGFEDGDFDSAKLLRPAASVYCAATNCLFFVDSENHAIRRANLQTRMLDTVYPVSSKSNSGIWSWILEKLGFRKEATVKSFEFDSNSFTGPLHLIKSGANEFLIINRSFQTLWIMDTTAWQIKEVIQGSMNIMEICDQIIMEKVNLLKEISSNLFQQNISPVYPLDKLQYTGLMSSLATLGKEILFCETASQRILKCVRGSPHISTFQLTNFGVLGLPYWLARSPESIFGSGILHDKPRNYFSQHFKVLPGRCDIQLSIDIPEGTILAQQLQEGSFWSQARGSAVEITESETVATSSEKVGVAQQWFDELDSLAFSRDGTESPVDDEERNSLGDSEEEKSIHIDCAVNISPGTSEVIISAVVYLKLDDTHNCLNDKKASEVVLDIPEDDVCRRLGHHACSTLLLESGRGLKDLVFMKPMVLRIRLECGDHPKPNKASKEVVSEDSTLHVNVSLQ